MRIINNSKCFFVSLTRQIRVQNSHSGFQLRISREPNDTCINIIADRCMWYSKWGSMLLSWNYTGLSLLRFAIALLSQWLCLKTVRMGMAAVALVANVDNTSYMDAKVRKTCSDGEAIRSTDVRLFVNRSVDEFESKERWSAGSQSRGNSNRLEI